MSISRRTFLTSSGIAGAGLLAACTKNPSLTNFAGGAAAPAAGNTAAPPGGLVVDRPSLTHGIASGDIRSDGALIWARSDKPAKMIVETAATEDFRNARRFVSNELLTPDTGGTGRMRVVGLEPGQQVHYRVTLEDAESRATSEALTGTFTTAPKAAKNIRLHWSGDVVGQGFGINPDLDGMFCFRTMADRNPDVFIHSGDTCYADNPIEERPKLTADHPGASWRNVTFDGKTKVAETIDEYRAQYQYNLMDEHYKAFNAKVAQLMQWDDHEVCNNWYGGEILDDPKYTEKNVDVLARRAWQAFHEWQPIDSSLAVDGRVYRKVSYGPDLDIFMLDMRSYKDDNSLPVIGGDHQILGQKQRDWLIKELNASEATWKVVANDLPLGIVVPDKPTGMEAVSSGTPGKPEGRETELAEVLRGIKNVSNVVWLTADVHYTAAHHYHPERAQFQDFRPFWEFVSGPLHAGAFGPNKIDETFGPEVVYIHAPGKDRQNLSPLEDFQHFGEVDINAETKEMTVRLLTTRGNELWSKTLPAEGVQA